jgi:hypothetical protein
MYTVAPDPISAAYFLSPFHQSVYLYMCVPTIVARRRLIQYFASSFLRGHNIFRLFMQELTLYNNNGIILKTDVFVLASVTVVNIPNSTSLIHIREVNVREQTRPSFLLTQTSSASIIYLNHLAEYKLVTYLFG